MLLISRPLEFNSQASQERVWGGNNNQKNPNPNKQKTNQTKTQPTNKTQNPKFS